MLVMSKGALSVGQAETYYQEKYSEDDYYTESHRVTGEWYGKAAETLGLSGAVSEEDFRAILRGTSPGTSALLVSAAAGRDERRAGWDATFNAPKSVSIQALVGDDSRLVEAHRHAVERALLELEGFAQARQRRGQEWITTANIVAARFEHIAARPSETGTQDGYGPDPHLHTHVVIANMTLRPDGMWRSLDPVEIYRSQSFATAVYRSELGREVQALGYRISVTAADGRWELQGYTREQVMAFSRRRQDIEALLNRQNSTGAAAAQIAAHQSRLAKEKRTEDELRAEWQARAHDNRIALDEISERALARGPSQAVSPAATEEAVRFSVAHNTEREAVTDRRALERTALQYAMGIADLESVRRETGVRESRGDLIALAVSPSFPGIVYTTPAMVAAEAENIELTRAGRGHSQAIATEHDARSWAAARSLTAEQAQAAALTLTATDWLTAIEGRAGAAKTTTVGALNDFAESAGYAVRGFAPTTRAVKALSEAGLQSRTVASLLASPLPDRAPKELWIIDESSLLGTHQMNALLHKAREAEAGRVVFVGDQRQHHAIEAGRPIQQMQQAGMPVARLETIRRQLDPGLRAAVTLASRGEIGQAIALLEQQGRIREIVDPNERHAAIAREYLGAHEAGEKVLVVSPANDERRQLNAAIRTVLKERGQIASDGREQIVLVNRELTRPQRKRGQSYDVGDVLRFRRGSARLGIDRGSYARIEAIDPERNQMMVRDERGEAVTYDPARLSGVEVFHRERRVLGAGDRIQFRAPDRALGVANGEFATIIAIDDRKARLHIDNGREISATIARLKHIDYGYASTSHSSQGATVDRVLANIDTLRSAELVNRKQFYVSISRARYAATIYTDDRSALQHAVSRTREKSIALERLDLNVGRRDITIVPEPRRQTITPSYGIRR
jgi:conjugative relaxase-like TrwC/TraI family protein